MKKIIIIIPFLIFKLSISFAEDLEITKWFNEESKQFLEIMNNSDGEQHYKFEQYKNFVDRNFAIKSIAYGLINEKILENNNEDLLLNYQNTFKEYLTKTIYNLANSATSGEIVIKDIDLKDNIYIVNSDISDGKNSISLYWKVVKLNDNYKILDVIVENTSYFVTKKSEFNKILRKNRGSLEALIIAIQKI